ncbi:MAG: hypothetical protein AB8B74_06085 [Crocinitomicaceae bacterium]
MKIKNLRLIGLTAILGLLVQGCMYDLRSKSIKKNGISIENTKKGKEILQKAWLKHGFDNLKNFELYSYHGNDTWKGVLGNIGKIWPENKGEMDFKYQIGTFNGRVTFLDGSRKGDVAGLQNWKYYEISNGDTIFKGLKEKSTERIVFGVSAFQYFAEMIDRLKKAPIISYAGEAELRGKQYDLVFCTWGSAMPHMEHDQYIAWVNKETGLLDFTQYTIRDNFLRPPGYKSLGGGIEFTDFKLIKGMMIPHEHIVYAIKLRKNQNHNLHRLLISDFKFDAFDTDDLRIDKNIEVGGDFK